MYQKTIVLLFLLVNTSFAFDTCNVLFVIDGSCYWPSFRGEMASISTTGNLLYSSSAVDANPNFWLYGDGDQDQPIPNWFYSTKDDFLDNVAEVQTNEGKETIVGATAKLNRWQLHNAVIVLYTASPQNLISIAGYNYTEQYRTLAIHLNDGVDMSPISDYPSPQMSEFLNITELVADVCRQLPTERPSTSERSTSAIRNFTRLTTTTIPLPPVCPVFFYIDGSAAQTVIDQQTDLIKTMASLMYAAHEWSFWSTIGVFGQLLIYPPDPDPHGAWDNLADFLAYLNSTDFSFPSGDDVRSAIDEMNKNFEFGMVLTILFVAAPQATIDEANDNLYKGSTYGVGMIGNQDLTRLSYDSDDFTTDLRIVATLRQAIVDFCTVLPNGKQHLQTSRRQRKLL